MQSPKLMQKVKIKAVRFPAAVGRIVWIDYDYPAPFGVRFNVPNRHIWWFYAEELEEAGPDDIITSEALPLSDKQRDMQELFSMLI